MKAVVLALALFAGLCGSLSAIPVTTPYRAFCKTMWLFANNCSQINIALAKQIQAFSPEMGCEMCMYNLVKVNPGYISANHTSPDGLKNEMISMTFLPTTMPNGCRVSAVSQSSEYSTYLMDNGVNYCNLHNLVAASGLASLPDFMEMTNEWACLSYGRGKCGVLQPTTKA